jgi:acyl carrier protein
MPLDDALRREVIEIVARIAEVALEEIPPDADLERLGVDSLDGLRIVAAVEKKYGIVIEEAEVASIRSMRDVFRLVERFGPGAGPDRA